MFSIASCAGLALANLLMPASVHLAHAPVAIVSRDTGTTTATSTSTPPVLLTPSLVAAYTPVWTALWPYLQAHPDLIKFANHNAVNKTRVRGSGPIARLMINGPNYSALVQHDSGVASLFTKYHVDPAQFAQTQFAARVAIASVVTHASSDSTTVLGKNMTFVQAHRQDFAIDWRLEQAMMDMVNGLRDLVISHASQFQSGGAGDLSP